MNRDRINQLAEDAKSSVHKLVWHAAASQQDAIFAIEALRDAALSAYLHGVEDGRKQVERERWFENYPNRNLPG